MRTLLGLVALFGAFLVSGCGGAQPGDSCDTNGFLCNDEQSALECRAGTWTRIPCRGPRGCVVADDVICDMSRNLENDPCPATLPDLEGDGICTADGKALLTCRQGTMVKTNTCSSCVVTGTAPHQQVTCNP